MNILKNAIQKIKTSDFWNSVIKLSAGQIISQVIVLLATLILSRIYTNSDYGDFGIITSTAAIVISGVSLALGSAVMIAKDEEESQKVFCVAFYLQLFLTALVTVVIISISSYKQLFVTAINYNLSVILMFLYVVFNILSTMLKIYINRLKLNKILIWNSLITSFCTVLISIPFGLLKWGFSGLLIAAIMANVLSSIHMLRAANPIKLFPKIKDYIYVIKNFRRFILFQYPSNLMGTTAAQLPNQTLSDIFGNNALGSYGMCNRIFQLPMNLLASPIQTIYFRTVATQHKNFEAISDFTYSLIKKFMFVTFFPIIIIMSLGEPIFSFVLGKQWSDSGLIASIMALYFLFFFCNSCITYLRVTIGKQIINLLMTIFQLILGVAAIFISKKYFNTVIGTITVFAVINTLFNIVDIFINFCCLRKNAFKFLIYSASYCAICVILTVIIRTFIY